MAHSSLFAVLNPSEPVTPAGCFRHFAVAQLMCVEAAAERTHLALLCKTAWNIALVPHAEDRHDRITQACAAGGPVAARDPGAPWHWVMADLVRLKLALFDWVRAPIVTVTLEADLHGEARSADSAGPVGPAVSAITSDARSAGSAVCALSASSAVSAIAAHTADPAQPAVTTGHHVLSIATPSGQQRFRVDLQPPIEDAGRTLDTLRSLLERATDQRRMMERAQTLPPTLRDVHDTRTSNACRTRLAELLAYRRMLLFWQLHAEPTAIRPQVDAGLELVDRAERETHETLALLGLAPPA